METKVSGGQGISEITFTCRFCGESKPLSELTLQTRFFPVLTACRACEKVMQNLGPAGLPIKTGDLKSHEATPEES